MCRVKLVVQWTACRWTDKACVVVRHQVQVSHELEVETWLDEKRSRTAAKNYISLFINLSIIFAIYQLVIWSIKCRSAQMTVSNDLFCPQLRRYSVYCHRWGKKQEIFTYKNLEWFDFLLSSYLKTCCSFRISYYHMSVDVYGACKNHTYHISFSYPL